MIIRTPELKLMDQRKNIHAQLSQKRSAAGKAGKGATAFVPKKKKDDGLQKRIERVVKMAKENDAVSGQDVFGTTVVRFCFGVCGL